jgi:inosine-uridine nucleoside N-ribohydrolase
LQSIVVVGGHINISGETGNVFSVPSNKYAEFNFFLDPRAAKSVIQSGLDITLVPLQAQRKVASFEDILQSLQLFTKTPELKFANRLLSLMNQLQKEHQIYFHVVILHIS